MLITARCVAAPCSSERWGTSGIVPSGGQSAGEDGGLGLGRRLTGPARPLRDGLHPVPPSLGPALAGHRAAPHAAGHRRRRRGRRLRRGTLLRGRGPRVQGTSPRPVGARAGAGACGDGARPRVRAVLDGPPSPPAAAPAPAPPPPAPAPVTSG